jgi:hypothetical protein
MSSLCIVAGLHVAVNNTEPLSVTMETQEMVPFTQLSSYKIFVLLLTVQMYSDLHAKSMTLLSDFSPICSFTKGFSKSPQYQISLKSVQLERMTDEQK